MELVSGVVLVVTLLALHLVTDALIRPDKWLRLHRSVPGLVLHGVSWAAVLSLPLLAAGIFAWWKLVFLALTHAVIDFAKPVLLRHLGYGKGYLTDQLLHVLTIIVVLAGI